MRHEKDGNKDVKRNMSRSYKHTPVCTDGCCTSGVKKYWKRKANRKVRRTKGLGRKSKNYKKIYESWDICDYRFYMEKERFEEKGDLMRWKKYYYRK